MNGLSYVLLIVGIYSVWRVLCNSETFEQELDRIVRQNKRQEEKRGHR